MSCWLWFLGGVFAAPLVGLVLLFAIGAVAIHFTPPDRETGG